MTEQRVHREKTVRVVTDAMVVIIAAMTAHARHVWILVHDLHEMTEHPVRRERIVRVVIDVMVRMVVIIAAMTAHAHRVRILVHDLHEMTEHPVRRERIVRVVTDAMVATRVMREVQNPPTANHCPAPHNATAKCAMVCARWLMDTWCVARNVLHRANRNFPKSATTAVKSKPTLPMVFAFPNI
jgi:hypothetical protein